MIDDRPAVAAVLKVAVTDDAAERVTLQVLVPLHAPDHPAKLAPASGIAVSTMAVPLAKFALHVVPQSIPAGLLVTEPVPVPVFCTVSAKFVTGAGLNVAVTDALAESVTLQPDVPLHAPDQPANVEPEFGVALNATAVAPAKVALHVDPQLMPAGELLTLPVPPPAFVTVKE